MMYPPKIHQIFWFFCGSPPPGSLWTIMKTCCASGGFILVVSHHDASETPTDVSEALSISLHACWPVEKREALNDMSLLMEWQPPFYVCIPWLPTITYHAHTRPSKVWTANVQARVLWQDTIYLLYDTQQQLKSPPKFALKTLPSPHSASPSRPLQPRVHKRERVSEFAFRSW